MRRMRSVALTASSILCVDYCCMYIDTHILLAKSDDEYVNAVLSRIDLKNEEVVKYGIQLFTDLQNVLTPADERVMQVLLDAFARTGPRDLSEFTRGRRSCDSLLPTSHLK